MKMSYLGKDPDIESAQSEASLAFATIQATLSVLRKSGKITDKEYKQILKEAHDNLHNKSSRAAAADEILASGK